MENKASLKTGDTCDEARNNMGQNVASNYPDTTFQYASLEEARRNMASIPVSFIICKCRWFCGSDEEQPLIDDGLYACESCRKRLDGPITFRIRTDRKDGSD